MKICPIHDVQYPDNGFCWCCQLAIAKQPQNWQAAEQQAQAALDAAEKALTNAATNKQTISAQVQAQLEANVKTAQDNLAAAQAALASHTQEEATQ